MIRSTLAQILGHVCLETAHALGVTGPAWETELQALREQVGDLDAAVAEKDDLAWYHVAARLGREFGEIHDLVSPWRGAGPHILDSVKALVADHARLTEERDSLKHDNAALAALEPLIDKLVEIHGASSVAAAVRWAEADKAGLDAANGEIQRLQSSLDAARDALTTASSCLDREGEPLVGVAIQAIDRGLGRAPVEPTTEPPTPAKPPPIHMRLLCPRCHVLHIDVGAFATKPHHTHACQSCGEVWRPAVVHTVGVEFLPGFKNEPAPADIATPKSATGVVEEAAQEARDPLTNPQPGDWFVDGDDGTVRRVCRVCDGRVYYEVDGEDASDRPIAQWIRARARYAARPMTPAEIEAFKRDGTRPAHKPERDTLAHPEPGDLYVDKDGETWFCRNQRTYTLRADDVHIHAKRERFRPASPEEIAKFRRDHNL